MLLVYNHPSLRINCRISNKRALEIRPIRHSRNEFFLWNIEWTPFGGNCLRVNHAIENTYLNSLISEYSKKLLNVNKFLLTIIPLFFTILTRIITASSYISDWSSMISPYFCRSSLTKSVANFSAYSAYKIKENLTIYQTLS